MCGLQVQQVLSSRAHTHTHTLHMSPVHRMDSVASVNMWKRDIPQTPGWYGKQGELLSCGVQHNPIGTVVPPQTMLAETNLYPSNLNIHVQVYRPPQAKRDLFLSQMLTCKTTKQHRIVPPSPSLSTLAIS